jgi:capsular exopolysaccharide synthesis family protein
MSQIFDALLRSEAERSGGALSALPEATELLRRAELHAASQRETGVKSDRSDAAESAGCDTSFGLKIRPPVAMPHEILEAAVPPLVDKHSDVFGLFQYLAVSLSPQSRLPCITDNESPAAEAFRLLGVRLRHLRRDRPLKSVLITSTIPQEGKSMVAANLACTLALRTKQRTLLLEGDVRRPSLSTMFGIGKNAGICECLQGERSLMTSIYHLEGQGFWILPAGNTPNNPLELLQSGKLSSLMDQLNAWFDWIIIDSPPVLPMADTSVWMRLADGILLVTRQGTTESRQLQRGLEALESQKLIGALLNNSAHSASGDYYYRPTTGSKATDGSIA